MAEIVNYPRISRYKTPEEFRQRLAELNLQLPVDDANSYVRAKLSDGRIHSSFWENAIQSMVHPTPWKVGTVCQMATLRT